jgi:hypothetical protein
MANRAALEIDPDIRQATTLPAVHHFHRLFAAAMRGHAG